MISFLTYKFLIENSFPTPNTFLFEKGLLKESLNFPLIIKPRFGSASIGVQKCENYQDVKFYAQKISEPILQEFLQGDEITLDVLCDFEGNPLLLFKGKGLR